MTSIAFGGSLLTGVSIEKPYSFATALSILEYQLMREVVLLHGRIAPSAKVSFGFGITSSGAISKRVPKPVQSGQAPCGELKEKLRGASSGMLICPSGQANFCDKIISLLESRFKTIAISS